MYQDRWIPIIGWGAFRVQKIRESAIMVVSMVVRLTVLGEEPPGSGSGKSQEFLMHSLKYFQSIAQDHDPPFLNFNS